MQIRFFPNKQSAMFAKQTHKFPRAKPIRSIFITSLSIVAIILSANPWFGAGTARAATPPPAATIDNGPGGPDHYVRSGRAMFTFSSSDATVTFECKLEISDWEKCPNGYLSYSNMTNGNHVFTVRTVRPELATTDPAKYGPSTSYSWTSHGEIKEDIIPGDIARKGKVFVVSSASPSLVSGDTNGLSDVFWGMPNRGYVLVSTDSNGVVANGASWGPRTDDSGMIVAYSSKATNLVSGDTNGVEDVLIRNKVNNTQERITSLSGTQIGPPASPAKGPAATKPAVSANGSKVAYVSYYGPSSPKPDVYVYDIGLHKTTKYIGQGDNPSISGDGTYVAYESLTGYPPIDSTSPPLTNIKVKNTATGVIKIASVDQYGHATNISNGVGDISAKPDISSDGRYVAFETNAVLGNPDYDHNNGQDIYVYDSQTNRTYLISKNFTGTGKNAGNSASYAPSITSTQRSDGTFSIVFETYATDLGTFGGYSADTNNKLDVMQWTGTTTSTGTSTPASQMRIISRIEGQEVATNGTSRHGIVSPEGAFVLFQSDSTDSYPGITTTNQKTLERGWWPEADLTADTIAPRPSGSSAWSAGYANLMVLAAVPFGGDDGPSIDDYDVGFSYWPLPEDRIEITNSAWALAREKAQKAYNDCKALGYSEEDCLNEEEGILENELIEIGDNRWKIKVLNPTPPGQSPDASTRAIPMRSSRIGPCPSAGLEPWLSGAGTIAPPITQWP